ncbi:hypothetical protein [Crocosphaera chwakensis]|uniref:Uncharacterized protein n=1 Tax=Crocosphaera chwakensis CCY0110 TaxID=391612 RepID=A3IVY6_9CHRO|nr:hypothetical protein [Crocosphaera chwakensis]EAZ89372.1 hypothetical protein CY0110_30865 [Crocosphaera chwakensis CCY0110]
MAKKPKQVNDNREESANKINIEVIMTDSAMKETIKAVIEILMIITALLGVGATLNSQIPHRNNKKLRFTLRTKQSQISNTTSLTPTQSQKLT